VLSAGCLRAAPCALCRVTENVFQLKYYFVSCRELPALLPPFHKCRCKVIERGLLSGPVAKARILAVGRAWFGEGSRRDGAVHHLVNAVVLGMEYSMQAQLQRIHHPKLN
jgi:hypothetical protein